MTDDHVLTCEKVDEAISYAVDSSAVLGNQVRREPSDAIRYPFANHTPSVAAIPVKVQT